jgi:hypothetical protein
MPPIRGPERAYYQRLTGEYSKVSSNGTLTLTTSELAFRSRIGRDVTVPVRDITDVRAQKIRRFHIGGADAQLVIVTALGEIGFLLKDPEGWAGVVHGQLASEPPGDPPARPAQR